MSEQKPIPLLDEAERESLAKIVVRFIQANIQSGSQIPLEVKFKAFDVATLLTSAYEGNGWGTTRKEIVELAIELLERAQKLVSEDGSPQPFVWSSDDYSSLS